MPWISDALKAAAVASMLPIQMMRAGWERGVDVSRGIKAWVSM